LSASTQGVGGGPLDRAHENEAEMVISHRPPTSDRRHRRAA